MPQLNGGFTPSPTKACRWWAEVSERVWPADERCHEVPFMESVRGEVALCGQSFGRSPVMTPPVRADGAASSVCEIEAIDRMYRNLYSPRLQTARDRRVFVGHGATV